MEPSTDCQHLEGGRNPAQCLHTTQRHRGRRAPLKPTWPGAPFRQWGKGMPLAAKRHANMVIHRTLGGRQRVRQAGRRPHLDLLQAAAPDGLSGGGDGQQGGAQGGAQGGLKRASSGGLGGWEGALSHEGGCGAGSLSLHSTSGEGMAVV
jgi:hypothetical protein